MHLFTSKIVLNSVIHVHKNCQTSIHNLDYSRGDIIYSTQSACASLLAVYYTQEIIVDSIVFIALGVASSLKCFVLYLQREIKKTNNFMGSQQM